ncbi:hypothetical protein Q5P01_023112 [Channa striata]|uniref:SNTX thioredoxin-like domain-containing protein n=1 Tax=Channa striata TaxID=64152 RepID=A0AA88J5W6_CHASR|nr:hypothetical protein Q5P01_023112 [Channa striata]
MASDMITVAALGRPFTLGMLYNARKDELIPGVTFWDDKTLLKNTRETEHRASDSHIATCDSIESKCSLLDVDASLKVSYMSGLIEVGRSAKYLRDKKKFHNQSRVTFQYKATTTFKQLIMTPPEAKSLEQVDDVKNLATHVVTGILYGANAFFVFDSERLDTSNIQGIQGQMHAVIKKIPSFCLQDKVDINLTNEEEALTDNFSCKFFGDLTLESSPSTFEDAVKTYVKLQKQFDNRYGKGGVPLKVWLMPLKKEDSEDAETGISIGLLRKAEDALEDIWQLEMRCNDCLEETVDIPFPQLHEKLKRFKKLCKHYTAALQQQMAKTVPRIRAGAEDERNLIKIFEDRHESPFSHENLSMWMDNMEREILVIKSCVTMMGGIKIIPNEAELGREVLAPDVDEVFCFVFTSLKTTDHHLQIMAEYVDSLHVYSSVIASSPSRDQWYYSDEVITKLRGKANICRGLIMRGPKTRVFVAAIANTKHIGGTIFHYSNGILVSDSYSKTEAQCVKNKNQDFL